MHSESPINVLFIASWFPNKTYPTLGNFVARHARAIAMHHRVFVVHPVPVKGLLKLEYDLQTDGNLTTCILYHPALRPHRLFRMFFYKKAFKHLGFTPDLIHLNVLHPAGVIAVKFAQALGIKIVATEHWTGFHDNTHNALSSVAWQGIRAVARNIHTMCPVTEHLAQAMQRRGLDGRYHVIANVVDTQCFYPAEAPPELPFTFLHVSSLYDVHKNISGLLRAFRRVHAAHPEVKLRIIGDGDVEPHRRYAHSLGLPPGCLTFEGASPIDFIASAMRNAHAFVLFSNYENLPCVIGESFASGVPVISTDVGGISEHLTPDHGFLIAKGDEDALVSAMTKVVNNPNLFNRDVLRNYAENHFSEQAIARAYDHVYRQALHS